MLWLVGVWEPSKATLPGISAMKILISNYSKSLLIFVFDI